MDHLVIGDIHSGPTQPMDRLTWISKYALDHKVEKIIQGGDFFSMDSLCSYDKGKRCFEGRRYQTDIQAAHKALATFNEPIRLYNRKRALNHKSQYTPEKYYLVGNHENRINKAVDSNASELEGLMSMDDLQMKEYGWGVTPFLTPLELDGILYSHYFTSGVKGYAIGGHHAGYRAIKEKMQSCTSFHSHRFSLYPQHLHDGTRQWGCVAGCYFTHWENYAGPDNHNWDRGVMHKHNVQGGNYDPEWISIEELERRYG